MSVVVVPGTVRGGQVEFYAEGVPFTATVGAGQTATGGLMVEGMAGDRVVRTSQAATLLCLGVALWDAAAGAQVAVAMDGVWMLTASGAITSGSAIHAAAAGVVITSPTTPDPRSIIGRAIADITTATQGPCKVNV